MARNSRMPAKNKFYAPGHDDFVPASVDEMKMHIKRKAKGKKVPKKKKAVPCLECGQMGCKCSDK